MLSSTKDYLQALRDGDYLLFLEWPRFVMQRYREGAADYLVDLLIFEWLNNDFSEEDVIAWAQLGKINKIYPMLFKGDLAYSSISITTALYYCMVYEHQVLHYHYWVSEPMPLEDIKRLMANNAKRLEKDALKAALDEQQRLFDNMVLVIEKDSLEPLVKKIAEVIQLRYYLIKLLESLKALRVNDDELLATREGVVSRLSEYVFELTQLTPAAKQEILSYLKKLRELQPSESERLILDKINIKAESDYHSFIGENTWKAVASIGKSLFSLFKDEPLAKSSEEKALPSSSPRVG